MRHGHLNPFGWWPRAVRKAAGPLLSSLERRLRRAGANPVDAPLWLLGVVLVGGLLIQGLVGWVGGVVALLTAMRSAGPGAWIRLALSSAIGLIMAAVIVRVIGSWLGIGRHTKWMGPVFLLTDWVIRPIARWMPKTDLLDLSPFVAYLLLLLVRSMLDGASM